MKSSFVPVCLVLVLLTAGCSISPEKPVTRRELYRTNVFTEFAIKDSPESVLATLNRDGEAVLEGRSRYGEEYYIKYWQLIKGL